MSEFVNVSLSDENDSDNKECKEKELCKKEPSVCLDVDDSETTGTGNEGAGSGPKGTTEPAADIVEREKELLRTKERARVELDKIGLADYQFTFFEDLSVGNDCLSPPALIPKGYLSNVITAMVHDAIVKERQKQGTPHKSRRRRGRR